LPPRSTQQDPCLATLHVATRCNTHVACRSTSASAACVAPSFVLSATCGACFPTYDACSALSPCSGPGRLVCGDAAQPRTRRCRTGGLSLQRFRTAPTVMATVFAAAAAAVTTAVRSVSLSVKSAELRRAGFHAHQGSMLQSRVTSTRSSRVGVPPPAAKVLNVLSPTYVSGLAQLALPNYDWLRTPSFVRFDGPAVGWSSRSDRSHACVRVRECACVSVRA
jgi:hypothetical protein